MPSERARHSTSRELNGRGWISLQPLLDPLHRNPYTDAIMNPSDPCQYSKLTIPTDISYVGVVGAYVRQVAQNFGFDATARQAIVVGVDEAVSNIIREAFSPDERATLDISCERVSMGLKIVIKDKGLPFKPTGLLSPKRASDAKPLSGPQRALDVMKQTMDEVSFRNMGLDGKETHLIKYLQTGTVEDYYQSCEIEPYQEPRTSKPGAAKAVNFEVRPMQSHEAIEVSKCFYKSYGYSFVYRQIYYPERIVELNEIGQMESVVAVTPDNEVIGHCALLRWDSRPDVAEIGLAVVKPEFRGQGCLTRLTEYLIERAKSEKAQALFVMAATNHTYSQQVIHRFGFNDCCLLAGFGPATLSFRGLTEKLPQRETYLISIKYLEKPEALTLYPPEHHKEFIRKLYRNIGLEPQLAIPAEPKPRFTEHHSKLTAAHYSPSGFGWIEIEAYGSDVVQVVKARLKEFCLKHIEVIQLYCNLGDPLTYYMIPEFEQLGFFFIGLKPSSTLGDALILEYFNNMAMDYDRIKLAATMGEELRSYVRKHDPNQE
jgi:anti-sigma regulatory factor (Ser/Thr protein kinase)/predicted GNAT family N-acyltransferase